MTETVVAPALDETAYREAARAWLAQHAAEYAQPPLRAWSEDELVTRDRRLHLNRGQHRAVEPL